jgi:hypothetical protein
MPVGFAIKNRKSQIKNFMCLPSSARPRAPRQSPVGALSLPALNSPSLNSQPSGKILRHFPPLSNHRQYFLAEKPLSKRRKGDKGKVKSAAARGGEHDDLALDRQSAAHGPLAQPRQRRPRKATMKICRYSALTHLIVFNKVPMTV